MVDERIKGMFFTPANRLAGKTYPETGSADAPTFTKHRAETIRAYVAEWTEKNESDVNAQKIQAYVDSVELFKI